MDAQTGDNAKSYEPDRSAAESSSTPFCGPEDPGEAQAGARRAGLDRLFSFFVLSENGLDELSRILGLICLLNCWQFFKRLNWIKAEYQVETWWWHDQCLSLPDSEALVVFLICVCAVAALAMVLGVRGKVAPAAVAACTIYITCLDINLAFAHSFFLNMWMCVALLFRREGESSSRRLIQLALFACYALSGLQKLFSPDFLSGQSLAAMQYGRNMQGWVLALLNQISVSPQFWHYFAIAVIALELFLAFGLWHHKTRKIAVAGIFVFQLSIFLTMDTRITPLHLTVFACCLSFFNPFLDQKRFGWLRKTAGRQSEPTGNLPDKPGTLYKLLTVFVTGIFFAIPLRIYFYPGAFERMSLMDRRPWTFCMFVSMEGRYKTSILLTKEDGSLVFLEPRGRMAYLSSDSDMYALSKYLEKTNPGIVELKIESQYDVNIDERDHKVLTAKVTKDGTFRHHIAWHREHRN